MNKVTTFLLAALGGIGVAHSAEAPARVGATPLMQRALTGIAGKEGLMLEVNIPPGGSSASHRHDADVFVYVLAGSVIMQVAGGAPQTLVAGQTFFESPSDVHVRSENASKSEPAKLLVFFVKDAGAPATRPAMPAESKSP